MTNLTRAQCAKAWREALGISQATLAAMLGDYSARAIRNFERGAYSAERDKISDRAWTQYARSCQVAYKLKEPPF